ncbi:hypothetical protein RND71_030889 [Anisodus tanguticus]|uniref:Copper transport protein n=1 Tax=Anisodus tanguticus TaxID=243964 RepID=A0AAE1RI89_9SOLA|nr:hypothetical protein RND71_030889 [Anisodus tanguticus]
MADPNSTSQRGRLCSKWYGSSFLKNYSLSLIPIRPDSELLSKLQTQSLAGMMMNHRHMMMHMTFFWGKNTEILFSGWPGYDNLGMYILALVVIFFMAFFIEFLSHSTYISESNNANHVTTGLLQTTLYGLRSGLAYIVMLAVMSFNGGVFLIAIVGHSLGFLVFGSQWKEFRSSSYEL